MSAADRILADLEHAAESGRWVCGVTEWAREGYCLSFAQRISRDLRGKRGRGIAIESRLCRQHPHRATVHEYRLVPKPLQLFA